MREQQKEKLKEELRDRIKTIQLDIARLKRDIIVATDEKRIHEEDLQFHLELLDKLGGFESEAEEEEDIEEISVEIGNTESEPQHETNANDQRTQDTEITGVTIVQTIRRPTKAEIQEAREKAKAWHLDRTRDKERKQKK
jgi:hypothetical protein